MSPVTTRLIALFLTSGLACASALACSYPDEGNMPLRRAVAKVKYLPATQAWAEAVHREGGVVQYALLVDSPQRMNRACYWPLEVRAQGRLWRRFYVTPDGRRMLQDLN